MRKINLICLLIVLFGFGQVRAQGSLQVTPADSVLNPLQSIIQALVGAGVEISDIQLVSGAALQFGSYSDTLANGALGPSGTRAGLIMTTGSAVLAQGPNDGGEEGAEVETPGFDLLDSLLVSNTTEDACVISFKVRTSLDTIAFNYVFGSEEYNSFVGSTFNDIFGFFISGPGIVTQPGLPANTRNLAIVPGTTNTPVAINNVNRGFEITGASFPAFYINNTNLLGDQPAIPQAPDPARLQSMQYDGITTVFTAFSPVQRCEEYTLTFAIADVGDGFYDSGVFIEKGSLRGIGIDILPTSQYSTRFDYAVAGCAPGVFVFKRSQGDVNTVEKIARFEIAGTAVNGVDYTVNGGLLPDSVIIPVGADSVEVFINTVVVSDPTDVKTILLIQQDLCSGENQGDTARLVLRQEFLYEVADASLCQGDSAIQLNVNNPFAPAIVDQDNPPFVYTWAPATGLSCTDCESPMASPDTTTLYTLTVVEPLSGCVNTSEALVSVLTPPTLTPVITLSAQTFSITNNPGLDVRWFRNDTLVGTASTITASLPGFYSARFVNTCGEGPTSNLLGFNVTQSQTISFDSIPDQFLGSGPLLLVATASSGLPVSFTLLSGPGLINGSQYQLTGVGTVTIQASQAGDADFDPAPPVARTFEVLAPCLTPQNLSASNITTTTATLSWAATVGAQTYTVERRVVGDLPWTSSQTAGTSLVLTGLLADTEYEFRVRSNCEAGQQSDFSPPLSFTTQAQPLSPCEVPTNLSATIVNATTATLNWSAAAGAQTYTVERRPVGEMPWSSSVVAVTSLSLTNLLPGTTYEYRVLSNCLESQQSDFSEVASFTTPNAIPGTWTGVFDTDYDKPSNWSANLLPGATQDVIIPAAAPNMPVLSTTQSVRNLTIEAGASVTITSTGTLQLGGDLSCAGIYAGPGTTVFVGSGSQSLAGPSVITFGRLLLSGGGTLTLDQQVRVRGEFILENGSTLALTSRTLTLLSDASGTARIPTLSSGAGTITRTSGRVVMQRFIGSSQARYFNLGTPMLPAGRTLDFPFFLSNNAANTLFWYDEAVPGDKDLGWKSPAGVTGGLPSGRGFIAYLTQPQVISSSGLPHIGTVPAPVSYTNSGLPVSDGWNLVSNVYCAEVSWADLFAVSTNLTPFAYVRRNNSTYQVLENTDATANILSSESFFVKATASNPSLSFTEVMKASSTGGRGLSASAEVRVMINLIQDEEAIETHTVRFRSGGTMGYESNLDALYLAGGSKGLYSLSSTGEALALHTAGATATDQVVGLGVFGPAGAYQFDVAGLGSVPAEVSVRLVDALTGTETDVRQVPSYSYQHTGGTSEDRFALVFGPAEVTGLASASTYQLRVYPNPATEQLRISGWAAPTTSRTITLYDALGRQVRQVRAAGLVAELDVSTLPAGMYSLRVQDGVNQQTEKVVIRR